VSVATLDKTRLNVFDKALSECHYGCSSRYAPLSPDFSRHRPGLGSPRRGHWGSPVAERLRPADFLASIPMAGRRPIGQHHVPAPSRRTRISRIRLSALPLPDGRRAFSFRDHEHV